MRKMERMSLEALRNRFRFFNATEYTERPAYAHIVFTRSSFSEDYPLKSRTYVVSSNEPFFMKDCFSTRLCGSCLDGSDKNVRLDSYIDSMNELNGGKVAYCYTISGDYPLDQEDEPEFDALCEMAEANEVSKEFCTHWKTFCKLHGLDANSAIFKAAVDALWELAKTHWANKHGFEEFLLAAKNYPSSCNKDSEQEEEPQESEDKPQKCGKRYFLSSASVLNRLEVTGQAFNSLAEAQSAMRKEVLVVCGMDEGNLSQKETSCGNMAYSENNGSIEFTIKETYARAHKHDDCWVWKIFVI